MQRSRFALVLSTPAFAQQTTGNISGRITDDQNAAVPGLRSRLGTRKPGSSARSATVRASTG